MPLHYACHHELQDQEDSQDVQGRKGKPGIAAVNDQQRRRNCDLQPCNCQKRQEEEEKGGGGRGGGGAIHCVCNKHSHQERQSHDRHHTGAVPQEMGHRDGVSRHKGDHGQDMQQLPVCEAADVLPAAAAVQPVEDCQVLP